MNLLAVDPSVTAPLDDVLSLLAWLTTAAGVGGLLWLGILMAVAVRSGDRTGDFVQSFLIVLVACAVASAAGPVMGFLL